MSADDILSQLAIEDWDRVWEDEDMLALVEHFSPATYAAIMSERHGHDEYDGGVNIYMFSTMLAVLVATSFQSVWGAVICFIVVALIPALMAAYEKFRK